MFLQERWALRGRYSNMRWEYLGGVNTWLKISLTKEIATYLEVDIANSSQGAKQAARYSSWWKLLVPPCCGMWTPPKDHFCSWLTGVVAPGQIRILPSAKTATNTTFIDLVRSWTKYVSHVSLQPNHQDLEWKNLSMLQWNRCLADIGKFHKETNVIMIIS